MIVNFATEDDAINESLDLAAPPSAGAEVEVADGTVYTVERVRYVIPTGEVWCLIKGAKTGGKPTKKPHPWKDK